jgi:hypothetical protein
MIEDPRLQQLTQRVDTLTGMVGNLTRALAAQYPLQLEAFHAAKGIVLTAEDLQLIANDEQEVAYNQQLSTPNGMNKGVQLPYVQAAV